MSQTSDQAALEALRTELLQLRSRIPQLEQQADELSRSRRLQSALYQISELTHTAENISTFYALLHRIVGSLMYAENFFIALREPDSGELQMAYFKDSQETAVTPEVINSTYTQEQLENTLFAYVIRSGEMLHVDREQTELLARQKKISVYGSDSVDWLGVPLRYRDSTFGALVVQTYDASLIYSEDDEQLLEFVNQHIATALQRKWAEDALRRAKDELEERVEQRTRELSAANEELEREIRERRRGERIQATLFRIAQLAGEPLELEAFYRAIHEAIADLIDAPNIYVALVDERAGMLRYPYIVDQKDGTWPDEPLPQEVNLTRPTLRVLNSGEPFLFISGQSEIPAEYVGSVPEAWLGVPLKSDQRTIGLLAIQSFDPATRYDERDMELLTFVAQHIATAILRREAKQALQQANDQLERRVDERTRELREANSALRQTLERLETAQGQLVVAEKMASLGNLVAGVAHEINTPLGVAVTAATHLQERCRILSRLDEAGRAEFDFDRFTRSANEAIGLVLGNLRRASDLVASFKQVAADQSTEDRRVFNLRAYLEEILTSLQPRIRKTGHKLTLECPEDIELDGYPAALYRIVSNLILNSVIHAFGERSNGAMTLTVEPAGAFVRMVYRDDGSGIDEQVGRRIYEPFFTTRRGEGGTGLGMHIVYNHVVQLGGSIHLESIPGEGVCFTILMPLRARDIGSLETR